MQIGSEIAPTSTAYWFYACSNCASIDLTGIDSSKVTDMSFMFYGCRNRALNIIGVNVLDTKNVEYMSCMFQSCKWLKSLDVSKFNTEKVKDMNGMFNSCGVTSLDVSN